MNTIKVLVVDDSALMRKLLTELLNADPGIEVVGAAMDAYVAREMIKRLNPDVLTLDVEMPKMDGISFLSNLMRLRPMPVIMVSTLTEKGAAVTCQALEIGAVDFVEKPKFDVAHALEDYSAEIITKVKVAARARVDKLVRPTSPQTGGAQPVVAKLNYSTTDKVIAIGASTGGTEAIKDVLMGLPPDVPGIVITQHIPPVFSRSFAERMNQVTPLTVHEAVDGQQIRPGHAYVAPGGLHLSVVRDGAKYACRIDDSEPVNRHKPSVDVLFESVANAVGNNAVGVILTGMGKDGALGQRSKREAGAKTNDQDKETCDDRGMPRAAVDVGGAESVKPLGEIADEIQHKLASLDCARAS